MDGEEVEEVARKKEKFTAEKLLFVITVIVFVFGAVLMYYGVKISDVEKETKNMADIANQIKASLQEVEKNVNEINEIVNRSSAP